MLGTVRFQFRFKKRAAFLEEWKLGKIIFFIILIILSPAVQAGECDDLAANPVDPQKIVGVPGVSKVNPSLAIPACEKAVKIEASPRNYYQLARAYDYNKQYDSAVFSYTIAADQGYQQAKVALGQMAEVGAGQKKDISRALFWYKSAAESGSENGRRNFERLAAAVQNEKDRQKNIEEQRKRDLENIKICQLAETCKIFATERNNCAVAGSFETCMAIRMGEKYYTARNICKIDGTIANYTAPSALECVILKSKSYLQEVLGEK
jgi:TPR repeat protein